MGPVTWLSREVVLFILTILNSSTSSMAAEFNPNILTVRVYNIKKAFIFLCVVWFTLIPKQSSPRIDLRELAEQQDPWQLVDSEKQQEG